MDHRLYVGFFLYNVHVLFNANVMVQKPLRNRVPQSIAMRQQSVWIQSTPGDFLSRT
jgi:hypothetical protein